MRCVSAVSRVFIVCTDLAAGLTFARSFPAQRGQVFYYSTSEVSDRINGVRHSWHYLKPESSGSGGQKGVAESLIL